MSKYKAIRTFEDWWTERTQYGTEDKTLARDAWFAGQKVIIDFEFEVARLEMERERKSTTLIDGRKDD